MTPARTPEELDALVERLLDHARNVGGDPSFERLYGVEACNAAATITDLRARIAELERKHEQ